ncbi:PREDICTED: homogentisate phytyltransferase 1, chloroplastic-like [Lupinus angustifolius]|uniref:homogentisate phytyltransferase 1, chloroplastic-like n=1 Tax=Lupinus angustifolius TaxID=3871 RepID=UPI00092EB67E|nr:PREDICTED: homogentisate phytyltransferase 1, chloroplastic-like [Lupinus angustifolius]
MDSLLLGSFPKPSSFTIGSHAPTASWHKRKIQKEHNFLRFKQLSLNHTYKGIKGGCTSQECSRKYVVKAASEQSFESEPQALDPKSIWDSAKSSLDAFYRFSRPHTVIGTALSIISVSLLAVQKTSDLSPLFFTGVLEAVVAALFMNIYIVGLNQLSDVEIDKINKPYLPLASGEYSFQTGVIIVASFSILSFWLGWIVGSWPLFWALFVSFLLGTAYSINIPFLRWKRFAVLAAMCILAVRAVIVQLAFFLHIQTHVYKRPAVFSKPLIFATAFMSFFSVVIALFKDIPDIEGDKIFGIQSFSVRLGQKKVFWICVLLLEIAYGVALLIGAASPFLWSKIVTGLGHAVLALVLWYRAKSVDLKSKASITSFYMFIWKLFYAEYLLIPLVR